MSDEEIEVVEVVKEEPLLVEEDEVLTEQTPLDL